MAQKSAFLTAFDEMQKKNGGFSAPAPMESVVDTVGQAPAVQSPFSQASAPNSMAAAVDPMAQTNVLAAAPAVQAPQGQVPMLGGFEVRGAGKERFDLGTPGVPETLFSTEYTDPGGNNAAIQAAKSGQIEAQSALQSAESERQRINKATQDRIDTRNEVGINIPDLLKSTVPYIKEGIGMAQSAGEGIAEFFTGKDVEIPNAVDLRMYDASVANDSAAERQRLSDQMIPAPTKPGTPQAVEPAGAAPVMDGTQIPKAGEEGFKFAERGSPQDYFLSQTNDGTTPLSPEKIARGQEYAKQRGLNFDPITGFSQGTAAPQAQLPSTIQNAGGQNLAGFKPKYEGQSLTDYMAGRDDPSAASVQVQDPQGRFRRQAASVAGETLEQNQARTDALFPEQADFQQKSADREARQAARPDFGEAVSDRDRRAARGEGISDADRRDIAKAQSPNASASDRARGMKVAEKAGLDWRTGQPLKQEKETGGLTDYQAITAKQRQTEIDLKIADGMEEKEAKRAVAYEESRSNVRSTQDSFDKLRPVAEEIALLSGSKFTEGAIGWTASKLPFSTDAAQIERLTTEFEGSAFLQGLIDAKAKGATFGALSEREGDRILGQWGKITSPKSTNEERIRAVNSMLESIQRASERAASDHKEKFPDRSARSSKATAQGSPEGKRHAKDQDHGAKVETYFQT